MTEKSYNLVDLPEFLTVAEVAKVLRISVLTVKRWKNFIPVLRINKRQDRRYRKTDLMKFMGVSPKLERYEQ